jgi:DNA repair exonuclease SbcCD ATPase subunit
VWGDAEKESVAAVAGELVAGGGVWGDAGKVGTASVRAREHESERAQEREREREREKLAAQKELERIRRQLLELENIKGQELESIKGQVASLGGLVQHLRKEKAQLGSEVQTVRSLLSELRDKLAKEAAALQQAVGDKEQALTVANAARGAERELRKLSETLQDSLQSVQAEGEKCKADLEEVQESLQSVQAQLVDLRALHREAAAALKNAEVN